MKIWNIFAGAWFAIALLARRKISDSSRHEVARGNPTHRSTQTVPKLKEIRRYVRQQLQKVKKSYRKLGESLPQIGLEALKLLPVIVADEGMAAAPIAPSDPPLLIT